MCIRTEAAPIYVIICSLRFGGGWEEEVNKIILQFSWKKFYLHNWELTRDFFFFLVKHENVGGLYYQALKYISKL